MPRRASIEIRRREIALYKTALHRAGVKRLPTLKNLADRGILRELGWGRYRLSRKARNVGMV
jgi:hypothetical protein